MVISGVGALSGVEDIVFVSVQAPSNSTELQNYNRGVQMGCWGLVVYAATAALCSGELHLMYKHTLGLF